MKPLLAMLLLTTMAVSSATIQQPVTDGLPTESYTDLVKWGVTQGGITLVLVVVLWSYRREFLRKAEKQDSIIEVLRDEKKLLMEVIKENTAASLSQALATAANTQATQSLATNVAHLERSLKP